MKIHHTGVAISAMAITFTCGILASAQQAPKKAAPPARAAAQAPSEDKVVLKVGSKQVTQSDFEAVVALLGPGAQRAVAEEGPAILGKQYATLLVLAQRAAAQHLDQAPAIKRKLDLQRLKTLAQAEYAKLARETTVSPAEIKQYYEAHKDQFQQAQVREIQIRIKGPDDPASVPGLPVADAKARADEISKALTAPGADISKIAKQYDVPNTVGIETTPTTIVKGEYPGVDEAVFSVKDGQVTKPFQSAHTLVLLQVVGHEEHLEPVSKDIEKTLQQKKLDATVNGLEKNASVWMDQTYFKPGDSAAAAPDSTPPPSAAKPPAKP